MPDWCAANDGRPSGGRTGRRGCLTWTLWARATGRRRSGSARAGTKAAAVGPARTGERGCAAQQSRASAREGCPVGMCSCNAGGRARLGPPARRRVCDGVCVLCCRLRACASLRQPPTRSPAQLPPPRALAWCGCAHRNDPPSSPTVRWHTPCCTRFVENVLELLDNANEHYVDLDVSPPVIYYQPNATTGPPKQDLAASVRSKAV